MSSEFGNITIKTDDMRNKTKHASSVNMENFVLATLTFAAAKLPTLHGFLCLVDVHSNWIFTILYIKSINTTTSSGDSTIK